MRRHKFKFSFFLLVLLLMAGLVGSSIFAAGDIDIGLRIFDGTQTVPIAAEPLGTLISPLRIFKNGNTYGVALVDVSDPNASKARINTSGGIKALRKLVFLYNHFDGYGHSWQSANSPKSLAAAVEACQNYYNSNPGQCASSIFGYATYAVNCPSAPGYSGFTVCDSTWEIQRRVARDMIIWIYSTNGFCGWWVGATGNSFNSCANPLVNWQ